MQRHRQSVLVVGRGKGSTVTRLVARLVLPLVVVLSTPVASAIRAQVDEDAEATIAALQTQIADLEEEKGEGPGATERPGQTPTPGAEGAERERAVEDGVDKPVNVELILDVSGSMAQVLDTGETRMEAAKRVLDSVIAAVPEREGVNVGLRIYGHEGDNTEAGRAESCGSSELIAAINPIDTARKQRFRDRIEDLRPVGWTPLALSLERAGEDFADLDVGGDAVNVVVLVTDGLETCGGDPCEVAGQINDGPADVATSVVGFALTPDEQAILSCIAERGGGELRGAGDAEELSDAIFSVLEEEVPDIVRPTPAPVASGPVGTRDNPVPLGKSAEVGEGWLVSVLGVIPDATEAVMAENMFNDPPAPGNQFFMVRVAATYQGPDEAGNVFELQFSLVGELQRSYQPFRETCGVVPENLTMAASEVFQGGTVEGNVCWSVPSGEVDSLVMYLESFAGGRQERVFFAL